jgi:hypothetical protein
MYQVVVSVFGAEGSTKSERSCRGKGKKRKHKHEKRRKKQGKNEYR